jgi:hypothetical protein
MRGLRTAELQVTEYGKKMDAPHSIEASETSGATKQRQYLHIHLLYSNARRSIVLDEVCKRHISH